MEEEHHPDTTVHDDDGDNDEPPLQAPTQTLSRLLEIQDTQKKAKTLKELRQMCSKLVEATTNNVTRPNE